MTLVANDYDFVDVAKAAAREILKGNTIHQKFTCEHCGARQTIEEKNKFFTKGLCEECRKITDIVKRGCNYLVIINSARS